MCRVILFVAIAFSLSACSGIWIPNKYWKAMDCYNGEYTGLDTLIRIDGYYFIDTLVKLDYYTPNNGGYYESRDTQINHKIYFSKDGFVTRNFYFKCKDSGIVTTEQTESCNVISGGNQGTYSVYEDTVKVQTLYWSGQAISSLEYTFLIRNRTNLLLINIRDFARKETGYEKRKQANNLNSPWKYEFSEFAESTHLNSSLYIKWKKKYYCQDELYRQYKRSDQPNSKTLQDAR